MASPVRRFLPPIVTLIFAILAFVFSLLTITSSKWAVRKIHNSLVDPKKWAPSNLLYTLHRSPFVVCQAYKVTLNLTSPTTTSNATVSSTSARPSQTWSVGCHHYRPFGSDKTSCELEVATQNDTARNVGDERLCQQIHYAGNFGITSTFFISLGFLLTAGMVILSVTNISQPRGRGPGPQPPTNPADKDGQEAPSEEAAGTGLRADRRITPDSERNSPPLMQSYVNLFLAISLSIGFVTALVSQFYGVLGLLQSQPNQADYASSSGGGVDGSPVDRTPWYQGVALSTYATCAWAFAGATATMALRTWRLPDWVV